MRIFLTGSTGGIGTQIRASLTEAGATVYAADRNEVDLSRPEAIESFVQALDATDAPFDWLVFSHGYIDAETDLVAQDFKEVERTFQLNTLSVLHLTHLLLPKLSPSGGVLFISSTAGLYPNGRYAAYSASKAAVNAFSQALARAYPQLTSIAVAPGRTNTAMRKKIDSDAQSAQSPEVVAQLVTAIITGQTLYQSGDLIEMRDGADTLAGRLPN